MAVANQSPRPLGASLEGVGQALSLRVLFTLKIRPRKKLISIHNGLFLLFYIPQDSFAVKTIE
jgi:hypothetical protein